MKTTRSFALGFVMLVAASAIANGQTSPSFDCSKASGEVEKLVCADEELAAIDRKMADVYAKAIEAFPSDEATKQRVMQRGWIGGRDECWKSDDVKACAMLEYRTRIVQLQIQSGQLMVPAAVGYACEGGEDKPFFATFYNETDPPSAVLTYGDDQVIAFSAPAASGAKYTASRMEFWEHGGEAKVDWYGIALVCKPL